MVTTLQSCRDTNIYRTIVNVRSVLVDINECNDSDPLVPVHPGQLIT